MDSDDMLMVLGGVVLTVIISFAFGVTQGFDVGRKKGADCILSGHKVTADYDCIDIDKLRGEQ